MSLMSKWFENTKEIASGKKKIIPQHTKLGKVVNSPINRISDVFAGGSIGRAPAAMSKPTAGIGGVTENVPNIPNSKEGIYNFIKLMNSGGGYQYTPRDRGSMNWQIQSPGEREAIIRSQQNKWRAL